MNFEKFPQRFKASFSLKKTILLDDELKKKFSNSIGAAEFLQNYAGTTFNNGLYRIHKVEDIPKWNAIVGKVFPEIADFIVCFSYDWLGRHFALDFRRKENDEPLIIILEPGTGDALEVPTTFRMFHEEELSEHQDAALSVDFFNQWRTNNSERLLNNQCVGYKVPLFIGGQDTMENLALGDMEVYWEICGQLLNKVRNLPPGTPISVAISD